MTAKSLPAVPLDAEAAYQALQRISRQYPGRAIPPSWVAREAGGGTNIEVLRALDKHVVSGAVELTPAQVAGGSEDILLRLVPRTSRGNVR